MIQSSTSPKSSKTLSILATTRWRSNKPWSQKAPSLLKEYCAIIQMPRSCCLLSHRWQEAKAGSIATFRLSTHDLVKIPFNILSQLLSIGGSIWKFQSNSLMKKNFNNICCVFIHFVILLQEKMIDSTILSPASIQERWLLLHWIHFGIPQTSLLLKSPLPLHSALFSVLIVLEVWNTQSLKVNYGQEATMMHSLFVDLNNNFPILVVNLHWVLIQKLEEISWLCSIEYKWIVIKLLRWLIRSRIQDLALDCHFSPKRYDYSCERCLSH